MKTKNRILVKEVKMNIQAQKKIYLHYDQVFNHLIEKCNNFLLKIRSQIKLRLILKPHEINYHIKISIIKSWNL